MENTSPAAAADALVDIRAAVRTFGRIRAVDGVDLRIGRGELFGLIGHNGAGKSTLFKMMLGLLLPDSGQIHIDGTATHSRQFRDTRCHIGYLPENIALYGNLSALETLHFFARLKNADPRTCVPALKRAGLAHAAHRHVREYSKGMRQRLGFAQALLGQPRILFLDEPTNGLDPEAIHSFYAVLGELRATGVTVVITSHILAEIQQRVDRLAIMNNGKICALGTVAELRRQAALPVQIRLLLPGGDAALAQSIRQRLSHLPDVSIDHDAADPAWLLLRCPHESKMAVFATLGEYSSRLLDISVPEAPLEEVFLGFSA